MDSPMHTKAQIRGRLSTWAAAMVIARRDFCAILFSRSFIFFLIGPLFPVLVGGLAGSVGNHVERAAAQPAIGIIMAAPDVDETPLPHERPEQIACRLALAKAQSVFRAAGRDDEGSVFLEATRKRMIKLNNDAVAMAKAVPLRVVRVLKAVAQVVVHKAAVKAVVKTVAATMTSCHATSTP